MTCLDFHSHLDFKDFDGIREKIIDDFFESGFLKLVTVADPVEEGSYSKTSDITKYRDNIYCVTAVHPHNADKYTEAVEKELHRFVKNNKVIGVGETGLDFYYNHSKPENQIKVFKRQVQIAKELKLPLIIHSREAENEVLRILEQEKIDSSVVFHCYTGNRESAEEILKRDYYISISGIVTFKKADYLREIVKKIPLERIFTETDSPFLSPEPFRGKTNTPLRVELVAAKISEIKGISMKELNEAINRNFDCIR